MAGLTYKDAGVDIAAGDALVERIRGLADRTRRPEVLGGIGGFAGLFRVPAGYREPVLVASTDGVGTKLKVAFAAGRHDTVGIDLVAMSVNDLVCCGAEPLFFLDYFATGRLSPDQGEAVLRGIALGCEQAGCALLGGETAEMPGFYASGEYDLAGFAVGIVERDAILDGSRTEAGDILVGLLSSGLHSNGYSLARRVLLEGPDAVPPESLLEPTRIYVRAVRAALATGAVHACAHITGGGIPGNLVRVLPEGVRAVVDPRAWDEPEVFGLIRSRGGVSSEEMQRTFNLGIGMVLVVDPGAARDVIAKVETAGESACVIGRIEAGERRVVLTPPEPAP